MLTKEKFKEIIEKAVEINNGCKPDWNNSNHDKYGLYFDRFNDAIGFTVQMQSQHSLIYFKSIENRQKFIDSFCQDDLIDFYRLDENDLLKFIQEFQSSDNSINQIIEQKLKELSNLIKSNNDKSLKNDFKFSTISFNQEKIESIFKKCEKNGLDSVFNQFQEECGELVVSINKLRRFGLFKFFEKEYIEQNKISIKDYLNTSAKQAVDNFYEEIADNFIMVNHMISLLDKEKFEKMLDQKMNKLNKSLMSLHD